MSLAATLTFAQILSMPTPAPEISRRGRPRVDNPAVRERHINCATKRLFLGYGVAETARRLNCSERTVQLWTRLALTYDDPRCEALRRLAGRN